MYGSISPCSQFSDHQQSLIAEPRTTGWQRTHTRSIWVTFGVMFMIKLQYGVFMITLWPYLNHIDATVSLSFYGLIQLLGQVSETITSAVFGFWVNKINQTKLPVTIGLFLGALGFLILGLAEILGHLTQIQPRWFVLIGQALTGFPMGVSTCLNAYLAMASKDGRQRSQLFSKSGALFCLAGIFGISLQLISLFLPGTNAGSDGFKWAFLNMYTIPAFICAAVGFIVLIIFWNLFHESWIGVAGFRRNSNETLLSMTDHSDQVDQYHVTVSNPEEDTGLLQSTYSMPYYTVAYITCCINATVFAYLMFVIRILLTPFTINFLDWDPKSAVVFLSVLFIGSTILQILMNLLAPHLLKIFKPRFWMITCGFLVAAFFVITFPYNSPLHPNMDSSVAANDNVSIPIGKSSRFSANKFQNNATLQNQFSDSRSNMINMEIQLTFGIILSMGIGQPILYVVRLILVSDITGPRKQGTAMGAYDTARKTGAILGSIISTILFENQGMETTWVANCVIALVATIATLCCYPKLVGFNETRGKHIK